MSCNGKQPIVLDLFSLSHSSVLSAISEGLSMLRMTESTCEAKVFCVSSPKDLESGYPDIHVEFVDLNYSALTEVKNDGSNDTDRGVVSVPRYLYLRLRSPLKFLSSKVSLSSKGSNSIFPILRDISGELTPGTMTLLLAPPGAGKSTFLKLLTDSTDNSLLSKSSKILFNGQSKHEFQRLVGIPFGKLVNYVGQVDLHSPFLTVRETLDFIALNSLVGLSREECRSRVDNIIKLLHLSNCENSLIGNEMIRGISGGEKRRVTIAEGLLSNAKLLTMDEISNGLDSAMTFNVVRYIRDLCREKGTTAIISLLQPTPEVFNLFDKVMLMRDSTCVFSGPREEIFPYFKSLGFYPPTESESTDLADWLASLLANIPKTYRNDLDRLSLELKDVGVVPPLSTDEMLHAWKSSPLFVKLASKKEAITKTPSMMVKKPQKIHSEFFRHFGLVLERDLKISLLRNKTVILYRIFSSSFMALVFGIMYYQVDTLDGITYIGLFMNTIAHISFSNFTEVFNAASTKVTAERYARKGLFPYWCYPVSSAIVHFPIAFIESLWMSLICYWMSGMYAGGAEFFLFFASLIGVDVILGILFRMFAFVSSDVRKILSIPGPICSLMIMCSGFFVTYDKLGWLQFFYHMNPTAHATRIMAIAEFSSPRYDFLTDSNSTSSGGSVGVERYGDFIMNLAEIDHESHMIGLGFGVMAAWIVVLMTVSIISFKYLRFYEKTGSARVNDADAAKSLRDELQTRNNPHEMLVEKENSVTVPISSKLEFTPSLQQFKGLSFQPLVISFQNICYDVYVEARTSDTNVASELSGTKAKKSSKKQSDGTITKRLLNEISGFAVPGRLLALMGASGAGKTTLLDVLSVRKNSGTITGKVLINGSEKGELFISSNVAYVEQTDIHMPLSTVREALFFSAELKLRHLPLSTIRAYVDYLLEILELDSIASCLVNLLSPGERKRLTIGVELASNAPVIFLDEPTTGLDARAAAVVMRVVKNVSRSGRTVVCTIHQPSSEIFGMFDDLLLLAKGGFQAYFGPVACPSPPSGSSSSSFSDPRIGDNIGCDSGDKVGRGTLDVDDEITIGLVGYLQRFGGGRRLPPGMNPASWMLDVLGGTDSSGTSEVDKKSKNGKESGLTAEHVNPLVVITGPELQKRFYSSPLFKLVISPVLDAARDVSSYLSTCPAVSSDDASMFPNAKLQNSAECAFHGYLTSLRAVGVSSAQVKDTTSHGYSTALLGGLQEWRAVLLRSMRMYYRDPATVLGRLSAVLAPSLLVCFVWIGAGAKAYDVGGVHTLTAGIFTSVTLMCSSQITPVMQKVFSMRAPFYKETKSRLYSSWVYSIGLGLSELPVMIAITLIVCPLTYFAIGLRGSTYFSVQSQFLDESATSSSVAGSFFFFAMACALLGFAYSALGQLLIAALPSVVAALSFHGILGAIIYAYGGFYVAASRIPIWSKWIYDLNIISNAFAAVLADQMYCRNGIPSVSNGTMVDGIFTNCVSILAPNPSGIMHEVDRYAYVSDLYESWYEKRWEKIGVLVAIAAVFLALAALCNRYKRFQTR